MANYSDAAIVRVVLMMRMHLQLVENVFHVKTKNAGIPDNEIAATCRDQIWHRLDDNVSADLRCEAITVQEIFPVHRDPFELAVGEDGNLEGAALPTVVAYIVALKTGLGGRTNRGRKYIAGAREGDVANSRLTDVRLGLIQADWDAMNGFFAVGNGLSNLTWGLVHRSLGGAPVPLGAGSYVPITSTVVRPVLGTMRSRKPGHGA